ncbi:MAG TPA: caspase family protein [Acidimicrobiales bacterium]|nr:caspase family protein [Acidimicrobiales bacterium]
MLRIHIGRRGLCLAALALLAPLQLVAVVTTADADPAPSPSSAVHADRPSAPALVAARIRAAESAGPAPAASFAALSTPAETPQLVTEPDVVPDTPAPAPAPAATRAITFADRFPAQAAAVQDLSRPATTRWAVLIGINEHRGTVADNIGSRQDAEDLRDHLLASGWRDDHILLLTDRDATRANIVDGIAWLAERTDQDSIGVFHYSGHSKKWSRDVDGDGEPDIGLWPHDDRYVVDSELVRLLDAVQPRALWISFATCNAAAMADPGMAQPGRVLTFSSGAPQKSYENPAWGNSVWGWFMIEQAFAAGLADADRDGRVTVQEAFEWGRPRARDTTIRQRYGPQDAVIVDQVPGGFDLLVPGAPRPEPKVSEPSGSTPEQPRQPAPDEDQQSPPPRERNEENHGNRICLLCGDR